MTYKQYAQVHASLIPQEIFTEYPDLIVEADRFLYLEARKGINGLKEAGLLAFKHLVSKPCPFWLRTYAIHTRLVASSLSSHHLHPVR